MVLFYMTIASVMLVQCVSSSTSSAVLPSKSSSISSSTSTSDWSDWIIVPSNNSFPEPYVLAISKRINVNSVPEEEKLEKETKKDTTSEITISIKGLAEKLQTAVGFLKDITSSDEDDEEGRHIEEGRGARKKIKKIKKKYKKFLLPLLLAYKLKFFALIPVMIAGLTLLVGTTGLAGFFFALFAAIMALKTDHKTVYKHGD